MDIIADIIQNSTYNEDAISQERGTILREMEEVNKATEERVFDLLHETAFPNHPLGGAILGPEENINSITRKNLIDYTRTFYTAPRVILSAAGGVSQDEIVQLAQKHFSGLPATVPADALPINNDQALYVGSDIRYYDENMPQAHFAVAFEGVGWAHPDAFNLMVMQHILGSGTSDNPQNAVSGSSLLKGAFESYESTTTHGPRTMASKIMSFNTHYKDTGLFGIYGACDPDQCRVLAFNFMKQFQALCYNVEEHDVERARNLLKTQCATHVDSSAHVAEEIARHLLVYGRHIPIAEMFQRIEDVTVETVQCCAMRYINDRDPVIASVGNQLDLPDWQYIRKMTYPKHY